MMRRLPHTPRRAIRRGLNTINLLLMCIPPLFNIFLVSFLSYYTVVLNNDAPNWILVAIFIDLQLMLNWVQFLRHQAIIKPSKKNFPGKKINFLMNFLKEFEVNDYYLSRPYFRKKLPKPTFYLFFREINFTKFSVKLITYILPFFS